MQGLARYFYRAGELDLGSRIPFGRVASFSTQVVPPVGTKPDSSSAAPEAASADVAASQAGQTQDWTEVAHTSGQVYYWNEKTGETTQLGEPRPSGSTAAATLPEADGAVAQPKDTAAAESSAGAENITPYPSGDNTGYYAAMGAFGGALIGWSTQFF